MINYGNFDELELYALALEDFKRENYAFCLDKLKVILARNQIPAVVYSLLGRCYATIELFEPARAALQHFVKLVPDSINELFHLAMVEGDLGNPNEALRYLDHALGLDPSYAPALYHKAIILSNNDEPYDAIKLLNQIIDGNNGSVQLRKNANEAIESISSKFDMMNLQ